MDIRNSDRIFSPARFISLLTFCLVLILAGYLRFSALGARSLWADEFCTWKVSQLPVGESLVWQPELTKPPLYQLAVRGVMTIVDQARRNALFENQPSPQPSSEGRGGKVHRDAPHRVPSEWHLRLPAAVCGVLAVGAMWWLGSMAGGGTLGAAAALLMAVNGLQLDYSQEARPYSMLMLGSMVSTGIWWRLNCEIRNSKFEIRNQQGNEATRQHGKGGWAVAYVLVTTLSFHANYLIVLTVAAHVIWSLSIVDSRLSIDQTREGPAKRKWQFGNVKIPAGALLATIAFCLPMAWHFWRHRMSVFQGLDWIAPATGKTTLRVLGEITFGWVWVAGLGAALLGMAVGPLISKCKVQSSKTKNDVPVSRSATAELRLSKGGGESRVALPLLFVAWLGAAWGGLLAISWMTHPAMVARYALPAAAPAILLPLIVLHRLGWRWPVVAAGLFAVGTAPTWATRAERVKPGFREMVEFLDEYADPEREAVVVAIERTTSPGWEEMDLLGFEYYESSKFKVQNSKKGYEATRQQGNEGRGAVEILYLRGGRADGDQPIRRDSRALWVVAFLADPAKALEEAGRTIQPIEVEDKLLEQLYFEPYRLIRVARQQEELAPQD